MKPTWPDLCPACRAKTVSFAGRAVYIRKRLPIDIARLLELRAEGLSISALAFTFGITMRQVYRRLAAGVNKVPRAGRDGN